MAYDFAAIAEEFLTSSDAAYQEVVSGVSILDRLIVSTPSSLADRARGYFVPLLYAYWERFFRISFGEYLRCISTSNIAMGHTHERVGRYRYSRLVSDFFKSNNSSDLHGIIERLSPVDFRNKIQELRTELEKSLAFPDSESWVETDSNVKFAVLKKNCDRFQVDIEGIKASFQNGRSLFDLLNDLVNDRNEIAHGGEFLTFSQRQWEEKRTFVINLLQALQFELYRSIERRTVIRIEPAFYTDIEYSI